jgi:hypothetical protein
VRELQGAVEAECGRLLRLLLVWFGQVPANPATTFLLFLTTGGAF